MDDRNPVAEVPRDLDEEMTSRADHLDGFWRQLVRVVAVLLGGFHLYTAAFGGLPGLRQRSVHLTLVLALVFFLTGARKGADARGRIRLLDFLLGCLALVAGGYMVAIDSELALRVGVVKTPDVVFGTVTILLLLIGTKRLLGWPLVVITATALLYAFFGSYLGPSIGHRGYSLERIIGHLYLTTEGIFGTALAASATVIAIFILFGAFLKVSGGADFITTLASAAFGHVRGGPAKVAVAASGLFGTLSGSAVANVAATGAVTIPLMMRIGYRPPFAAAVEATASAGGQLMPPVMGAAAFMIAEFLGRPYLDVVVAALIPAVLYYFAVFMQVHLEAMRLNLVGLSRDQLPKLGETLRSGWYLLLPIVVLVYLMSVLQWSPIKSGFWSIVATLVVSAFNPRTRVSVVRFLRALEEGAYGLLEVALACGLAGIVIGVFSLTGLGLKFSGFLVDLSGGNLHLLLLLTMLASLILGMGMATLPTYLVLAVLVAPALANLGVEPLAAHLFIFYFGIISAITPPVAVAAYAGAAIARTNPLETGMIATRLGLAGFLLPYVFVYHPALLMKGSPGFVAVATLSAVFGIVALAMGLSGYGVAWWERTILFVSALLLIVPGVATDLVGLALFAVVAIRWYVSGRAREALGLGVQTSG